MYITKLTYLKLWSHGQNSNEVFCFHFFQDVNRCDDYNQPLVHECVFWNFESNGGKGGWSTEGCWANLTMDNVVRCHCDHLTNFAVLAVSTTVLS